MQQARFFLWVLLLVATATVATTVATETKDLQANVRSLTRQLAADRLADRDRAEKELLALGPAVLDVLPDGQARLPAEANRRLTRIRRQLEERKELGGELLHLPFRQLRLHLVHCHPAANS